MTVKLSGTELEEKIEKALNKHSFAVLSTTEDNKPRARYMAVYHEELTVQLITDRRSHKVDQLEANPNANLLLGLEGRKWPDQLVDIQGKVSISKDKTIINRLWDNEMKRWFTGPDDPNIVVLELQPERIEYTADGEQSTWTR